MWCGGNEENVCYLWHVVIFCIFSSYCPNSVINSEDSSYVLLFCSYFGCLVGVTCALLLLLNTLLCVIENCAINSDVLIIIPYLVQN